MSCDHVGFDTRVTLLHKKSLFSDEYDENLYLLLFAYETLMIEEKVESLIYDFSSFLAAAGGNLGLFLGYSLFSAVELFVHLLKKYICA